MCRPLSTPHSDKVLADVRSEIDIALADRDMQVIAQQKEEWRRKATAALSSMSLGGPAAPDEKQRVRHRTKAFEWLVSTDHMLYAASALRWDAFMVPDFGTADAPPPQDWRICSLSIDQGSDGWGAAWFLMMQKRAGVVLTKDPSHRLWNDTWLSLEHCGLKAVFVILIAVLNADHGPWAEQRWLQSAREATRSFMVVSGAGDPLFTKVAPRIIREMGLQHRVDEGESLLHEIWDSLPECVYRVTGKVASSRWFGVFEVLDRFFSCWSRRLLVLQFMGIGLGLFRCERAAVMAKLQVSLNDDAEDVPKTATNRECAPLAALRKSCKNTLALCYLALADDDFYKVVRGVVVLVKPLRQEFQWQHKLIRSTHEACEAYILMACGFGRNALRDMVLLLHSGELASEVELQIEGSFSLLLEGGGMEPTHPVVLMDNLLCERLAGFCIHMIKNRLRSLSWSERGYLGVFAALLGPSDKVAQVMGLMRSDWELWKAVVELPDAAWRRVRSRSSFQMVAVQKAGGFSLGPLGLQCR